MLKAVYDADDNAVVDQAPAHKAQHQNDGDDEISVEGLSGELADLQYSTWDMVSGKPATYDPTAHKTSHQDGGTDEISVAGLLGTTPRAILGDATAGRVFRCINFNISDGTNTDTLKCTVSQEFNGDLIAETDNIAKNATTGHYELDASGYTLKILATGLSGNILYAFQSISHNESQTLLSLYAFKSTAYIAVRLCNLSTGVYQDICALVNQGRILLKINYITDA